MCECSTSCLFMCDWQVFYDTQLIGKSFAFWYVCMFIWCSPPPSSWLSWMLEHSCMNTCTTAVQYRRLTIGHLREAGWLYKYTLCRSLCCSYRWQTLISSKSLVYKKHIWWLTICSFKASTSSCRRGPVSSTRRCCTRTKYMANADRACTLVSVPPLASISTTLYLGSGGGGGLGGAGGGAGSGWASALTSWTLTSVVFCSSRRLWETGGVGYCFGGLGFVALCILLSAVSSLFPLPSPGY